MTRILKVQVAVGNVPVSAGNLLGAIIAVLICLATAPLIAREPPSHYRHRSTLPPGEVGGRQLERGGPLRGYFQPVRIEAPPGALISMAVARNFERAQPTPITVGMLIGRVYRFRITRIPQNEGLEVYPTIEVIDRLYPPAGQKVRFAVPVELTREELQWALAGKFVTRVIYLENPETALPRQEDPERQRYFEVRADVDPLRVADQLGRPMAILRMGGRIPDDHGPDDRFLFGSPPLKKYSSPTASPVGQQQAHTLPAVPGGLGRLPIGSTVGRPLYR